MTAQERLEHLNGEEDFEREVLKSEVPTVAVVDFFADWCGPCRAVSPIIESLSQEYGGRVRFAKVNIDDNQRLASRFDVESIPTIVIFNRGQVVDKVIGAAQAQVYRAKINAALGATAPKERKRE